MATFTGCPAFLELWVRAPCWLAYLLSRDLHVAHRLCPKGQCLHFFFPIALTALVLPDKSVATDSVLISGSTWLLVFKAVVVSGFHLNTPEPCATRLLALAFQWLVPSCSHARYPLTLTSLLPLHEALGFQVRGWLTPTISALPLWERSPKPLLPSLSISIHSGGFWTEREGEPCSGGHLAGWVLPNSTCKVHSWWKQSKVQEHEMSSLSGSWTLSCESPVQS